MKKKFELIIEHAESGELWGRILYGEDLLTSAGESLNDLFSGFKQQLQKFYKLDVSKISFDVKYDLAAFFEQYEELNITAIAKRAGINRVLLQQYKSGSKHPSEAQVRKIENAIHELASELQTVSLIAA